MLHTQRVLHRADESCLLLNHFFQVLYTCGEVDLSVVQTLDLYPAHAHTQSHTTHHPCHQSLVSKQA